MTQEQETTDIPEALRETPFLFPLPERRTEVIAATPRQLYRYNRDTPIYGDALLHGTDATLSSGIGSALISNQGGFHELAEWDRGLRAGLLSGVPCWALLSIVWLFIIIPDSVAWRSSGAAYSFFGFVIAQGGTIDLGWFSPFIILLGPSYGGFVGLWLAYNQSETKEPLSLNNGFRYGTTFTLPLAAITGLLIFVLSPLVLIVHLVSMAGIGVLLFGYMLTQLWNYRW